jgi:hypothetical protein
MGRAVNAESIMAIVSTATSFGHGHVAMRRLLQAPWVREMRLELGGHRHCRGALARVQPRAATSLPATLTNHLYKSFRDQMRCIDNLSNLPKVLARLMGNPSEDRMRVGVAG